MRVQVLVELRRPRWLRGRVMVGLLSGLALLAGLAPATLLATDAFQDVPTSAFYHDAVTRVRNAGITGGCSVSPPLYCPEGAVTRGQMAVFLDRALGLGGTPAPGGNVDKLDGLHANQLTRLAFGSNPGDNAVGAGGSADIVTVSLDVPVQSYVRVNVTGYAYAEGTTGCPCVLQGRLRMDGGSQTIVTNTNLASEAADLITGFDRRDASGSMVYLATPGTHTFTFSGFRQTGTNANIGFSFVQMQAELFPFGSTGAPAGAVPAAEQSQEAGSASGQ